MKKDAIWARDFIGVCMSCFFVFLTFYTLVTTLPLYVVNQFHSDTTQVGLVLTVFVIAALVSRPFAGLGMEKFGKKRVLIFSVLLFLVACLLYFVISNYAFLIVLRAVHGFSFGIATSATGTIAADVVPKKRMGEGLGYYGMFMSMSMVVGPFLGLTVIQHASFVVLFACLVVFALLALVGGLIVRVPVQGVQLHQADLQQEKAPFSLRSLFEPAAVPIALCGFLLAFAYGGISGFVSVYGNGMGMMKLTNYFFAVYAILVVLPRPILGRLFDRAGAHRVIYPGIVVFVIGQFLLSQAQSGFGFLGSAAVLGLGYGALFPSFQTLAVQSAPAHRKGFATSTFLFFYDAGIGVGSLLLGIVAGRTNYHNMYVVSTVVVAFTVLMYFLLHHRREGQNKTKTNIAA
jgi:MFS family permease